MSGTGFCVAFHGRTGEMSILPALLSAPGPRMTRNLTRDVCRSVLAGLPPTGEPHPTGFAAYLRFAHRVSRAAALDPAAAIRSLSSAAPVAASSTVTRNVFPSLQRQPQRGPAPQHDRHVTEH